MAFTTNYLIPIITGVFFLAVLGWLIFIIYWILKKIGLFRWRKLKKLKKQFGKDYEFKDEILEFVTDAIDKKWRYKDVKLISATMPESDEILYTYFLIKKLKKKEK